MEQFHTSNDRGFCDDAGAVALMSFQRPQNIDGYQRAWDTTIR